MPTAPMRMCAAPGCPELVAAMQSSGRCATHTRAKEQRRGSAYSRGYDGNWKGLREQKLSQNPLCERCEQDGVTMLANEVDHKVRIADWPGGRLRPDNLQSLCKPCHSRKTQRELSGWRMARLVDGEIRVIETAW